MNRVNMIRKTPLSLPSADWLALILGAVSLGLSRLPIAGQTNWLGLIGLAVFGPPLLREMGILSDADEMSRNIRWRAGFHAALAVALFVFLNRILYPLVASYPEAEWGKTLLFPNGFLRQTVILVFLISFLMQYWGTVPGVVRILWGFAGIMTIEGMVMVIATGDFQYLYAMLPVPLVLGGLAALIQRKPRTGAAIQLMVCTALMALLWNKTMELNPDNSGLPKLHLLQGLVQALAHVVVIFGATGLRILLEKPEDLPTEE